jgi:diguanylate cyclase (GGDEF)-like protein
MPSNASTKSAPSRSARTAWSRARSYALWGALLSQGSPLGALLLRWTVEGLSARTQLDEHLLLYAYMSAATLLAFTTFGWILGRRTDALIYQGRDLRHANHRLRWLTAIDPLTGVLNRRTMHRRLRAELKRAQRDDSPTALLLLDLDHFKQINDRFGHVAGDRVLRRVGRLLRRWARATDSVGRIGGEEFLVILPATPLAQAIRFANRLRALVSRGTDSTLPAVTASIGVSVRGPTAALDVESAIREADAAMYRAKADGRDRVCTIHGAHEAATIDKAQGGSGSIR